MHFCLEDPVSGERLTGGPVPCLSLCGNRLEAGPGHLELAKFRHGCWSTPSGNFAVLRVLLPVTVSFEDGELSETYGPFDEVLVIGGLLRYGKEPNAILARLDQETGNWEVGSMRRVFKTLVLEPPELAAAGATGTAADDSTYKRP
jgi:hypothetical protein